MDLLEFKHGVLISSRSLACATQALVNGKDLLLGSVLLQAWRNG